MNTKYIMNFVPKTDKNGSVIITKRTQETSTTAMYTAATPKL